MRSWRKFTNFCSNSLFIQYFIVLFTLSILTENMSVRSVKVSTKSKTLALQLFRYIRENGQSTIVSTHDVFLIVKLECCRSKELANTGDIPMVKYVCLWRCRSLRHPNKKCRTRSDSQARFSQSKSHS